MSTNLEVQIEQKKRLYMLLRLEKENAGIKINGLRRDIKATKAEMQQEDVAWVEKMIAEDD